MRRTPEQFHTVLSMSLIDALSQFPNTPTHSTQVPNHQHYDSTIIGDRTLVLSVER